MPYPLIGTDQANRPFDGLPPALRSRAVVHWRSLDLMSPPITGQAVADLVRTVPATVFDSHGMSMTFPPALIALSAEDWDGDGVREEILLRMTDEEALRFFDADTGDLYWQVRPLTLFHEFIYVGAGPLWSFTNDAASGAWLQLEAESDGTITWQHHNATSMVQSVVGSGLTLGDRCSVRAPFRANGQVQAYLVKNGGAESTGTASAAHTPAASWGGGSGCQARLNEFGDSVRGEQRVRTSAVYYALPSRRDLLEVL